MSFSSNSIPVMRPKLPTEKRLRKYLKRIDQNRIYTNYGPLVDDLTNRLASYFGVEVNQLILLTNGTLALQGAVATSSELGSMWNCPSWTFVATSQSIISAGCIPQFVDVGSDNWTVPKINLPANAPAMITAPFGSRPVGASDTALSPLIFDAASCFDACSDIGISGLISQGAAVMVSLHATKLVTTGEGGVLIAPESWIKEIRKWSNFGFYGNRIATVDATNAKMSEYQAAIGLASLDEWDENRILWMDVIGKLRNSLLDIGISSQPALRDGYVTSTFVAELPHPAVKDLSLNIFEKNKIESRDWWGAGAHRMPRFADSPTIGPLSNTNQLAKQTLGLPLFLDMSNEEIERVVSSLTEAIQIHNSGSEQG